MSMLMNGFLEYSGLAIVLCWLPVLLVLRQAALKRAMLRSIILAAAALTLVVMLGSLRLVRLDHPLTGCLVCLLGHRLYQRGSEWQSRTLLFGERLAFSPALYPQSLGDRDELIFTATLVNAWLVLAWSALLSLGVVPAVMPLTCRLWFSIGAAAATLAWLALSSWGISQLGLYKEMQLKFPNALAGGLLRALGGACALTTLVIIAKRLFSI